MDDRQVAVRRRGRREAASTGLAGSAAARSSARADAGAGLDAHLLGADAAHRVGVPDHPQVGQRRLAGGARRTRSAARRSSRPAGCPARARGPGCRPAPRRPERCGIAATSRRVYGCAAERKSSSAGPSSTIRPAYITATRGRERADHGQVVADVERRDAVRPRPARARCRARAPGSSRRARSSARPARSPAAGRRRPSPGRCAAAGRPRARAGSGAGTPASSGSATSRIISAIRSRRSLPLEPKPWASSTSMSCVPIRSAGLSAAAGSCGT